MNYPVIPMKNSNYCESTQSYYSDEYADEHCSLFLRDELVGDRYSNLTRYYRLHALKPHAQRDYLKYDIHCPRCSAMLRLADGPVDYHTLGLYRCPNCSR